MYDEKEVIEKVLSGDIDSFRLIVDQYKGLIFSICLNMTRDQYEAENLVQDVFIKAYHSLSTYKHRGFKTWISKIAVNKCLDYKRRIARQYEKPVPTHELNKYNSIHGPPVEELLIVQEEKNTVRKLCNSLPDIYRVVVTEYFIHSKGIRQIAEEKGLKVKTVETRLYRGLKILRKKWKEGYG